MPGSQGMSRQGLHTTDDRGSKYFQGEEAGTGAMPGVREGSGKCVTGGAPPKSARRDKREIGTGGQRGSRCYQQDQV